MIKLADLTENPKNARTISDEHFAALRKSVATRPWMFPIRPIVARRADGVVLGGNMRLRALLANGMTEVPDDWVRWVDLDDRQCEEMHVVDNESFGDWIADDLLALYGRDRLLEMDVDVDELLKGVEEPAPAGDGAAGKTDADAVPEQESAPKSVRGTVYQCGRHRLMCGDATSAEDVARLMGDERADIAFTSPPYNLMRTDILQALNSDRVHVSYDIRKGTYIHTRDDLSDEEYAALLIDSCRLCLAYCDEVFYNIGILSGSKQGFVRLLYEFREKLVDLICWKKNNFLPLALPAQKKMLGHPCEFVMAFGSGKRSFSHAQWKLGGMTNCIETTTAAGNRFSKIHHGTMPVDFAEKMLLNFSEASVLDVFGGTGTTMIAAEQTGRCARLMEIDPHYCDVIRRRWAEFVHGEGCDWESLTPEVSAT